MKVLLAAAEMAPIATVGGMAEAVAGLVKQLRVEGTDVSVVLPDYGDIELENETESKLPLPEWARPGKVRSGDLDGVGQINLVTVPWIQKDHPYTDANGTAFADNDVRFFSFSAAVAAMVNRDLPDILHLNDWHTAAALGFLVEAPPTVLSIHNLAYQGITNPGWMDQLLNRPHYFAWHSSTNPLLGGLRLADAVVTVSPNYSKEILDPENGMGLHHHLASLGDRLIGITNGIDTNDWNPKTDLHLVKQFSANNKGGKSANKRELLKQFGLKEGGKTTPVIGMVSRLVEQKGIDLVIDICRYISDVPAKLLVLGSGEEKLTLALKNQAELFPQNISFINEYDVQLAHQVFAGSDLLLMPSRFEPCGLAQMQAMTYGTIPIVTDVGGLADTVIDADANPKEGNGFVAKTSDAVGVLDAIYRAKNAWADRKRKPGIQSRGMNHDWSWAKPTQEYINLYSKMIEERASASS